MEDKIIEAGMKDIRRKRCLNAEHVGELVKGADGIYRQVFDTLLLTLTTSAFPKGGALGGARGKRG